MKRGNIYDRSLKSRKEVSQSAFLFLFSEMVQYCINKSSGNPLELEKQLEELGYTIGPKILELVTYRERSSRKATNVLDILRFIHDPVWQTLFNKKADELEQNTDEEDEFMINEKEPSLCNMFAKVPRGQSDYVNCAAFVAGIIEGLLNSACFNARVTAHFVGTGEGKKTVFLVKFASEIIEREKLRR